MSKVLVTGGAGFIGSNLAAALANQNYEVVVVDNLTTGHESNLDALAGRITFVKGDIRDRKLMAQLCKNCKFVFHQAALPSVPRSIADPWTTNDHNINGTLSVLISARDAQVDRVICAASSSAYGNTTKLPKVESMPPNPLSPYAVSKFVGELYASVFNHVYELETVVLRYFNVFGPNQRPDSAYAAAIPKFIHAYLSREAPRIEGDGNQTRDFTYVENVVQANIRAATGPSEKVAGNMFNIGFGGRISINDLVFQIKELIGSDIDPVYVDSRPGDVRDSQASIDSAKKAFGYNPDIGLEEGLNRTISWFNGLWQPSENAA